MKIPFRVVPESSRVKRAHSRQMFDWDPLFQAMARGETVEFDLPVHPIQGAGIVPDERTMNTLRRYLDRRGYDLHVRVREKGSRTHVAWAVQRDEVP